MLDAGDAPHIWELVLRHSTGGFDYGFERAGMQCVWQCEIDPYCIRVLEKHWPDVLRVRDIRQLHAGDVPKVDVLCGGFPCQDLSIAGQRAGLSGERSGLFFEFARCADEFVRPGGWIVVENVPGLFSSQRGRDFAIVLRALGDLGFHDLAWRVLDSRYFGVPQRRFRVYIVGRRAVGAGAREVLLEPESGGGDFAPGNQTQTRVAASLVSGSHRPGVSAPGRRQSDDENIVNALDAQRGGPDDNSAQAGHLVAPALVERYGKGTDSDATDCLVAHTLRAGGADASEDGTGRGTPLVAGTVRSHVRAGSNSSTDILCPAPDADGVRAPTRFPRLVDDPRPDLPRYEACGNAVTVPVAKWIGERIVSYKTTGLARSRMGVCGVCGYRQDVGYVSR